MRKKKDTVEEASSFTPTSAPTSAPTPPGITAEDIQAKEFRITRFRGYRERDVDEFLDQLTLAWGALIDENGRLRANPASSAAVGAPDLGDVSRQADEILARARTEAARIVGDAERRPAVGGPSGGPAVGADRASVSAFLAKEREFLQGLASLVQGHAEGVKSMARDALAKPPPVAVPTSASRDPSPPRRPAPSIASSAPPTASPATEPAAAPAPSIPPAAPSEPIRLEEPAGASVGTGEASGDTGSTDPGDRSLRELFWGEE